MNRIYENFTEKRFKKIWIIENVIGLKNEKFCVFLEKSENFKRRFLFEVVYCSTLNKNVSYFHLDRNINYQLRLFNFLDFLLKYKGSFMIERVEDCPLTVKKFFSYYPCNHIFIFYNIFVHVTYIKKVVNILIMSLSIELKKIDKTTLHNVPCAK